MAYDLDWVTRFEQAASDFHPALGSVWIVEHIGSTSVPGPVATPVIDLAVPVPTAESLEKHLAPEASSAGGTVAGGEQAWHDDGSRHQTRRAVPT